jgi:hypothetical protein
VGGNIPAREFLMRSRSTRRTASSVQLLIALLALLVASCAGRAAVKTTADDPARIDVGELWSEPRDLESRDLFHGSGGPAGAPEPSTAYELIAVDRSGYSPGYDVRDRQGMQWSVKLGIEAQPEVAASRVLWAIGYHQPATYMVARWELAGAQPRTQGLARFRPEPSDHKVVSEWSWYQNPFVTTRPFKGLVVANLILNNWDWKTSNNKVYEVSDGDGGSRRRYMVRDLGASLGKTTFPGFLKWTPFRGMGQGSRNDIEGFEEQRLIRSVEGGRVKFDYRGIHDRLVETVSVEDVIWTCRLMSRVSDQQWRDAFRAAGYDRAHQDRFTAKLRSKIQEGLALAGAR